MRGALARRSSAASGFFFCGMMLEPEEKSSPTSQKRELLGSTTAPSRRRGARGASRRSTPRRGSRATKSRFETASSELAVTDSKPRSRATASRSRSQLSPASAPGAQRQLAGRPPRRVEPPRVAPEHPEVGEQVVSEVHGLRALQVRVAGHRPVGVALGELQQALHQRAGQPTRQPRVVADEERDVRRHLVVPRPAGVELAAKRADHLDQAALDGHVDVLLALLDRERAALHLVRDVVRPSSIRCSSSVVEHPRPLQGPRMGPRLLDVVRGEPAIEADRGVQPHEERVRARRESAPCGPVYEPGRLARP